MRLTLRIDFVTLFLKIGKNRKELIKYITFMDDNSSNSKNYISIARDEYTKILIYKLYPAIYQGLKSIWEDAKRVAKPHDVYSEFQNRLTRVRKWNQEVIDNEYRRIVDKTQCDFLDDLIKRVFVINTQIMAAANIRHVDPTKKIKVKVPKGDKFIHQCYKECARAFFENALIMEDRPGAKTGRIEQLKNLQKANRLIMTCIENTIRNELPIENLLRDNMDDDADGEDATPPAILLQDIATFNHGFNQKKEAEKVKIPLSSFPTLTSVLQQESQIQQDPGTNNDNFKIDSDGERGSLQQMSDLGEGIGRDLQPKETFAFSNFSSLYTPQAETTENKASSEIAEHRVEDNIPFSHIGDAADVNSGGVSSVFTDLKEPRDVNSDSDSENKKPFEASTKTIYLGRYLPERKKKRREERDRDQNSDDSDNEYNRTNKDLLERKSSLDDIPVVKNNQSRERLDLDVFSANEELPVGESMFERDRHSDTDTNKKSVPPLEGVDSSENFFSDAE